MAQRRALVVLLSSALVGFSSSVMGAAPCAPPYVSLEGETASGACVQSGGYSTSFDATENPIGESGVWINGKSVGINWNNVRTASGYAYGADFVGGQNARYADPIAHLDSSRIPFSPDQFAEAVVFKSPSYSSSSSHEVELLLRFEITANTARGYEVLWGNSGYIAIVRWNGGLGKYTPLYDPGKGSISVPANGDVLRAEISRNTITVYKNGTQVARVSDSTYASGQPGIGFWPVAGESTLESLGWSSFRAGNL